MITVEACVEIRHTLGQHPAMTRCENGDLLLLYSDLTDRMEGQTGFLVRSRDEGRTWGEPELMLDARTFKGAVHTTLGMQTLRSGRILIPYEFGGNQKINPADPNSFVCLRSDDNGSTWQRWDPQQLGIPQFSPYGKIVELSSGTLLCPGWAVDGQTKRARNYVIRSVDQGETWSDVAPIAGDEGYNETDLTLLTDGRIVAMMRTAGKIIDGTRLFWVEQSISSDGGETWSFPERTNVLGQNFNAWMTTDGTLIGACRGIDGTGKLRASDIKEGDKRYTNQQGYGIQLFSSQDAGATWNYHLTLPDPKGREYSAWHESGEPCFANLPDGRVIVAYYSYDDSILSTLNLSAVPEFVRAEISRIPHAFSRRICTAVIRINN